MPDTNRNHDLTIAASDRQRPAIPETMPVAVVLDRLRSAFNTGNIFRLADAVRAERIITCGYTPAPGHPKLAKTARGCDETVSCDTAGACIDAVLALRHNGYMLYAVETARSAVSIWELDVSFPAAFIFGNEALGVSPEVLPECDAVVSLPRMGVKNSINVGNCAAVVLYRALELWLRSGRNGPANTPRKNQDA